MTGPAAYNSEGEAAVHDYLTRRRIPFEYEPAVGRRHPDFLAHAPSGDVVLEVYEPELRLPNDSGAFDSVEPLYGAFDQRKRKQAKASREAGLPFVVVVGSANSDVAFDWMSAVGAMRGRPGVSFPVGPGAPGSPSPTPTLIGVGMTAGGDNTSVSALALAHSFNPTKWRLEMAWRELVRNEGRLPENHDSRIRALVAIQDQYDEVQADVVKRRMYRPDLRRVRLSIYHNPDAAIRLPPTFAGVHDVQWDDLELDDGSLNYGPIAFGQDSWEWLRLER